MLEDDSTSQDLRGGRRVILGSMVCAHKTVVAPRPNRGGSVGNGRGRLLVVKDQRQMESAGGKESKVKRKMGFGWETKNNRNFVRYCLSFSYALRY